ncbi:uncharacterized protein LOC117900124 [Drosophila subobscura]|uniref:uncharacterized protein LOC117900124 n=1 Tax=Drosophila subobscura TaxID=7241 RepID=UPI00155AE1C0|nr:uncharacterized protein LOC117900124 [Drosophila subobscura]
MGKLTQIYQATNGTICFAEKQWDVMRLVQESLTRFEGTAIVGFTPYNAASVFVRQAEAVFELPTPESEVDSSDTDNECAPLLGSRKSCADNKKDIFYHKIQAEPDSSSDEEPKPDTSFDEEAQCVSSVEEQAERDSSSDEEPKPDTSFKEEAQSVSSVKEQAEPDSSSDEEPKPDTSFEEEAQYVLSVEEQAEPDSSLEKEEKRLSGEPKVQLVKPFKLDGLNGEATAGATSTYDYDSDDDVGEQQEEKWDYRGQAIPKCCLTDSVYMVERPSSAAMLNQKLPRFTMCPMENADYFKFKFKILVTNVYSPYHFWFQFAENHFAFDLENLHMALNDFYNKENVNNLSFNQYRMPTPQFFLRPGYICAAQSNWGGWKRVRIVSAPQENASHVSVFYVDYGRLEQISRSELRFLPQIYTTMPAMAVRGALTHLHPLAFKWPADVTATFRDLVTSSQSYGQIIEVDDLDCIYFIKMYKSKLSDESMHSSLIRMKLAGESDHFCKQNIQKHCGRRIRYICERLPSFKMLETGVVAIDGSDEDFNGLMSFPSYFKRFEIPPSDKPLRQDLEKALLDWIVDYKNGEMPWRKLEKEAALKAKEKNDQKWLFYKEKLQKKQLQLQAINPQMDED